MGIFDRSQAVTRTRAEMAASSFASKTYGWMTVGLGLTAATSWAVWSTGAYQTLISFWWIIALATLGIGLTVSFRLQQMRVATLAGLFLGYAFLEGLLFGSILPFYAASYGGGVIWSAFGVACVVFFSAMIYGVVTKSDLTKLGVILSFALMGLIGVTIVFAILSFFFNMTWMNLAISYVGLVIFVGLTAWDAQTIRRMGQEVGLGNTVEGYKLSLIMALRMYVNVIMIFWYLLQIFSSSSKR